MSVRRTLPVFGSAFVCLAIFGHATISLAASVVPEKRFAADQHSDPDADREAPVLRALHPRHPVNVEGLRLAATGTGFFISNGAVLTNFHVAGSCKALTVGNNSEGEELAATLFAADVADDLAVLSAVDPSSRPAQFQGDVNQETGSGLAIVGYPEHGLPVLQAELSEVVASPDDLASNRRYFPFAGPVRRGNSGSPVLDAHGAVLGIVRAKIDTPAFYRATGEVVDRIGYAISNSVILSFLRASHVSVELAPQGISLSPDELLDSAHGFVRQIGCWN